MEPAIEVAVVERLAALSVLVTGVEGHEVGAALTIALVDSLLGREQRLPEFEQLDRRSAADFAARHRIRSLTNRLMPGLGGDSIRALTEAVTQQSHLLACVATLESADVEVLVLKGHATGALDHSVNSDRESGDIDLLVRPDQMTAASSALERAGYVRNVTHPFRTTGFFHSETFTHPDGTEIDLHERLHQISVAPASCWRRSASFRVGGQTLRAMPAEWRFLHALVHQVMNPPPSFRGANGLMDLVVLSRVVDLAEVRRAATEIRLSEATELGLNRLSIVLGIDVPAAGASANGGIAARYARAVDSNEPTPGYLSLLAGLSVQPRRRWLRYLRELAWPTHAYRRTVGRSLGRQVMHVAREALGR